MPVTPPLLHSVSENNAPRQGFAGAEVRPPLAAKNVVRNAMIWTGVGIGGTVLAAWLFGKYKASSAATQEIAVAGVDYPQVPIANQAPSALAPSDALAKHTLVTELAKRGTTPAYTAGMDLDDLRRLVDFKLAGGT